MEMDLSWRPLGRAGAQGLGRRQPLQAAKGGRGVNGRVCCSQMSKAFGRRGAAQLSQQRRMVGGLSPPGVRCHPFTHLSIALR